MTSAEALDAMRPEIRPIMARKLYLNLHVRQAFATMHGNKLEAARCRLWIRNLAAHMDATGLSYSVSA